METRGDVADNLRQVFRTGQELYRGAGLGRVATVLRQMGQALQKHQETRRGRFLQGVFHLPELRPPHPVHDLHHELDRAAQKDFRRVTRMRGAMPNEESVILLMVKTAMDKKSYLRQVPRIDLDRNLFPDD